MPARVPEYATFTGARSDTPRPARIPRAPAPGKRMNFLSIPMLEIAACWLAAFGLFLTGVSPTVSFEDTGELAWAAASLGVTHPTGYPWLTMLGSLFMRIPAGDPAFRLNVMSAAAGAFAVACAFTIARDIAGARGLAPSRSRLAGWTAAAALATSRTFWWQASIGDKYTLSLALMGAVVATLVRAWRARDAAKLALPSFLAGLALSHHLHGLYLLPVLSLAAWRLRPARSRALLLAFLFILPISAKGPALAIRSAGDPELNWGTPDTAGRLYDYLAARQYRFIMGANKGPTEVATRTLDQAFAMPLGQFGPALVLAVPGLAALRALPGLLPGAGIVFATNLFLAVSYNTPEIERYYLLSYLLLAVLCGVGLSVLPRLGRLLPAVGAAAILFAAARNGAVSPRGKHYLAWDFAVNQLAFLPRSSLMMTEGDDQAFPLFYMRYVLGGREDTDVIGMPFLAWEPGYASIGRHHPGISLPQFSSNPGVLLPRFIVANSLTRKAFYTPGCSAGDSQSHLVPYGLVYEAYVDPAKAVAARRTPARFPRLRLRGVADAAEWDDPVTLRAARNYGNAMAFNGSRALEHGDRDGAARFLSAALRVPMAEEIRPVALTHLGMALAAQGFMGEAEDRLRRAIRLSPRFGPALFQLAKLLYVTRQAGPEIRGLLMAAAENHHLLNQVERRELAFLLAKVP